VEVEVEVQVGSVGRSFPELEVTQQLKSSIVEVKVGDSIP